MPPLNLYARVRFLHLFCTRDRGCSAHPAFPAPSDDRGRNVSSHNSCETRGEIAKLCLDGRHCLRQTQGVCARECSDEAIHFAWQRKNGLLRFARNDVGHSFAISPHIRASFVSYIPPSPIRGRRECRVHAAPAVSRANYTANAHTSIQVQRRQSDISCAMVLQFTSRSPW